jgi:hypothetical protein
MWSPVESEGSFFPQAKQVHDRMSLIITRRFSP